MDKDKIIKEHYSKVASNFGDSGRCTIQDPFIREKELEFLSLEIQTFIHHFERQPTVLDIGCGNGYSIEKLAQNFPKAYFVGIEPHTDLLKIAQSRLLKNAIFKQGSLLDSVFHDFKFDIVITERVIINLTSSSDQERALNNIANNLVPGGTYLMIESFVEPLQKINSIRKQNLLGDQLQESDHNLYMKFSILRKLQKFGMFTQEIESYDNLSPFFFLTRVFHPLTRKQGAKLKENDLLSALDSSFNGLIGRNLSPIQFFKFSKKQLN